METHKVLFQGISPEELCDSLSTKIGDQIKDIVGQKESAREYLTRHEVAEKLSISLPTLHDWCKRKILNPYRIGNRVYFKSDEIDQSLKQIN